MLPNIEYFTILEVKVWVVRVCINVRGYYFKFWKGVNKLFFSRVDKFNRHNICLCKVSPNISRQKFKSKNKNTDVFMNTNRQYKIKFKVYSFLKHVMIHESVQIQYSQFLIMHRLFYFFQFVCSLTFLYG